MRELRHFTAARVGLGRSGNSVPTREVLDFALAHARARDAIHLPLDVASLLRECEATGWSAVALESAARDRAEYLRRPDLGRRLSEGSKARLIEFRGQFDVSIAIADGLSAIAIHHHALALMGELMPLLGESWSVAPLVIVQLGRVAVSDEIGCALNAALSVILIGERPGLSFPDSLGIYLTWNPKPGRRDAERNCISNVHSGGLSARDAAHLLAVLMNESRARQLSGIDLKITSPLSSKARQPEPSLPGTSE